MSSPPSFPPKHISSHTHQPNWLAECVPVFWTGVSCLVDWFFSVLSLRCFDASTDTLVRVSNTTAMLFKDSVHVSAWVRLNLCAPVCVCVLYWTVNQTTQRPHQYRSLSLYSPGVRPINTRTHTHKLQKISVTFSLALSPVLLCHLLY